MAPFLLPFAHHLACKYFKTVIKLHSHYHLVDINPCMKVICFSIGSFLTYNARAETKRRGRHQDYSGQATAMCRQFSGYQPKHKGIQ